MVTECDKFADRFKAMENEGLVDVKFLLRNTDEATAEEVCREVYEMLDAFDSGEAVELDFKDTAVRGPRARGL